MKFGQIVLDNGVINEAVAWNGGISKGKFDHFFSGLKEVEKKEIMGLLNKLVQVDIEFPEIAQVKTVNVFLNINTGAQQILVHEIHTREGDHPKVIIDFSGINPDKLVLWLEERIFLDFCDTVISQYLGLVGLFEKYKERYKKNRNFSM